MSASNAVYIEVGARRCFACSLEWPGLSRSGKSEEAALVALSEYVRRYALVADRAGVDFPLTEDQEWSVVERVPTRSGGADFGAPTAMLEQDGRDLSRAEVTRTAALMTASWEYFDDVAAVAPESLRKGPRGGGRDREAIVDHVAAAEQMFGRQVGLSLPVPKPGDRKVMMANRELVLAWCRSGTAGGQERAGWPAPFATRRLIWHVLDHAWEIEDRVQ